MPENAIALENGSIVEGEGAESVREAEANPAEPVGVISEAISAISNADPVEKALSLALERASAAGEWGAVVELARQLEARRQTRTGVVNLSTERQRRGSK